MFIKETKKCKICDSPVNDKDGDLLEGDYYHYHCIEELRSIVSELRKRTKPDSQAIMYWGKDDESEITLEIDSMVWEFLHGICVCDLCNSKSEYMYFCPELGSKLICEKCFKQHKKTVEWHVQDTHEVLNSLVLFIQNYKINLRSKDKHLINEFFFDKGHSEFKIESFIKE